MDPDRMTRIDPGGLGKGLDCKVQVGVKVMVKIEVRVKVRVRVRVKVRGTVRVRVKVMMGRTSLIPTRPTLTIRLYPPMLSKAGHQAPDVF